MCVYVGVHAHACACAGKVWGRECWSPSLFSTIFLKDRRDCLSLKPKLMDLASWLASRVQQSAYLCPHPLPLLRVHPPKWISLPKGSPASKDLALHREGRNSQHIWKSSIRTDGRGASPPHGPQGAVGKGVYTQPSRMEPRCHSRDPLGKSQRPSFWHGYEGSEPRFSCLQGKFFS